MTCTADIACELHRIAADLDGWSWPNFLSTLAGALVALVGTGLFAYLDRRDRYRTRLDEALARVLILAAAYVTARRRRKDFEAAQVDRKNSGQPVLLLAGPPKASTVDLDGALMVVRLLARGRDKKITDVLMPAFLDTEGHGRFEISILQALREVIVRWRRGDTSPS